MPRRLHLSPWILTALAVAAIAVVAALAPSAPRDHIRAGTGGRHRRAEAALQAAGRARESEPDFVGPPAPMWVRERSAVTIPDAR